MFHSRKSDGIIECQQQSMWYTEKRLLQLKIDIMAWSERICQVCQVSFTGMWYLLLSKQDMRLIWKKEPATKITDNMYS